MHPTNKGLSHLAASTKYSLQGLKAMAGETAFVHELVVGAVALPLIWLVVPRGLLGRTFMTVMWMLLPTLEVVNTAIETVVDLVSPQRHPLAGKAKDLGSAAVFCVCLINVVVWLAALWTVARKVLH